MGSTRNENPEVFSIPVSVIRDSKEYLSVDFTKNETKKHELNSFVREVCSKNALRICDIVTVVRNSRESFSPYLLKMLDSISDKQLKGCIESFVYKEGVSTGYGSRIEYYEDWKMMRVDSDKVSQNYNFIQKLLKAAKILQEYFYYYDNEYVNLYITPDNELPLHINREWPSKEDEELYNVRVHKLEENKKANPKPNLDILQEA